MSVIKWQAPTRRRGSRSGGQAIAGSTILYHYLQKELLNTDIWLFQMLVARLIVALGIWLSPEIYRQLPVLLPFAARDPTSRGDKKTGIPDQWGSASSTGIFRDDNTLVKGLPKSLIVASGRMRLYDGRRIGDGFVASHIWRGTETGLAARHALLYSFVPNLVWLPAEVAKLSDREGSFVQSYLQALSIKIYRDHPISGDVGELAQEAWALLPHSVGIPKQGLPDVNDLNFFKPSSSWLDRRIRTIESVVAALDSIDSGGAPGRVVASRYGRSLADIGVNSRHALRNRLASYASAARSALGPVGVGLP
jgi:hypothetical protein